MEAPLRWASLLFTHGRILCTHLTPSGPGGHVPSCLEPGTGNGTVRAPGMGQRGNREWGSAGTENGALRAPGVGQCGHRERGSAGTENGAVRAPGTGQCRPLRTGRAPPAAIPALRGRRGLMTPSWAAPTWPRFVWPRAALRGAEALAGQRDPRGLSLSHGAAAGAEGSSSLPAPSPLLSRLSPPPPGPRSSGAYLDVPV